MVSEEKYDLYNFEVKIQFIKLRGEGFEIHTYMDLSAVRPMYVRRLLRICVVRKCTFIVQGAHL